MSSFRIKLVLTFVFFGISLISMSSFLFFKIHELSFEDNNIESVKKISHGLDTSIELYFRDIKDVLNAIEQAPAFKVYLNNSDMSKSDVNELFLSLASSAAKYMQLRYIDKQGMEKIRIDRAEQGATVFIVEENNLQNKASRDYFKQGMTSKELLSYSKVDLNIEHGVIEKPIKPVIRAIKKVIFKDELQGLIVLNIFMKNFLEQLGSLPGFDVYLIDKQGNYIIHPDKSKAWNLYLNRDQTLENDFASDSACILNNVECQGEGFFAKDIVSIVNPDHLKLIIAPKTYKIHEQMQKYFSVLLFVSIAVLLLSFPIAYLFSITPARLKNELELLNKELEKKIEEKVLDYKKSNEGLEKAVLQRTKELELVNSKLYKQTNKDYLTQILNRRYFFEMADRYLQMSHRKRQFLSFILFDIDYFKKVNDVYGHNVGDRVLKFLSEKITSTLREKDIFGRIGGEEFAIALLDMNLEQAADFAEKLRLFIQDSVYNNNDVPIKITLSFGVSQAEENEQDVSMIISRADLNLHRAKNSGGNKIIAFNLE